MARIEKSLADVQREESFKVAFPEVNKDLIVEVLMSGAEDEEGRKSLRYQLETLQEYQLIGLSVLIAEFEENGNLYLKFPADFASRDSIPESYLEIARKRGLGKLLMKYIRYKYEGTNHIIDQQVLEEEDSQFAIQMISILRVLYPFIGIVKHFPEVNETEGIDEIIMLFRTRYHTDSRHDELEPVDRREIRLTIEKLSKMVSGEFIPNIFKKIIKKSKGRLIIRFPNSTETLVLDSKEARLFIIKILRESFPDLELHNSTDLEQ